MNYVTTNESYATTVALTPNQAYGSTNIFESTQYSLCVSKAILLFFSNIIAYAFYRGQYNPGYAIFLYDYNTWGDFDSVLTSL